jgi:hypothetical protein
MNKFLSGFYAVLTYPLVAIGNLVDVRPSLLAVEKYLNRKEFVVEGVEGVYRVWMVDAVPAGEVWTKIPDNCGVTRGRMADGRVGELMLTAMDRVTADSFREGLSKAREVYCSTDKAAIRQQKLTFKMAEHLEKLEAAASKAQECEVKVMPDPVPAV